MRKLTSPWLLLCSLMFFAFFGFSQNVQNVNYGITEVSRSTVENLGTPQIQAENFRIYQIDIASLQAQMLGVSHRETPNSGFVAKLQFPHPDGTMHTYFARENSTMHRDLALQFPGIKSYDANGTNDAFVKWDITPQGFHAMIRIPGESTIFIDPIIQGNTDYYIVYSKKDFKTDKLMDCSFDSDVANLKAGSAVSVSGVVKSFGTCELRTYRLALAATGEYTTFHGGTAANAQAAQVTTMNRVNGIYEKDMAITMTIVANNNLLIYTNAGTDPYTNGSPVTMINENHTNCNNVIGNANYDIGHVFGTNSGGLAGLGVVCNNSQKGRGVTGSAAPVGDPFDVDYVAHEMGHQFGANHTFNNSCNGNRNDPTAVEPGSGSSIMAYAGICPSNVQNNSDDHFHGISLQEIDAEILSAGHQCEVITALGNNPPNITGTNGNSVVPGNTPFALTVTAVDPDGDPMTFNWEQMDEDISTQPPLANAVNGPNFRSYPSSTSPTRYFPNLTDLSAGGPFTWEVLSTVSRTMDFRVTVRDNAPGPGGCNDHADVTVTVDGNSGPFVVTYPSATGIVWAGASSQTVTWDVANTDQAPVNCTSVDILMSDDGGATYAYVLATGVPNDGSEPVTVPNIATTTARIMVISNAGTFFDISDNNFEVTLATFDYTLSATPSTVNVCQPNNATFQVDVGAIGAYTDPVALTITGVPAGATANFTPSTVTPVGTSALVISNTGAATPGSYVLTIQGNSTTGTKTTNVTLNISAGTPSAVSGLTPANASTGVAVPTTFTWTTAPEVGVTYEIDIASDAGFTTMVDQATGLATATYTSTTLSSATTYYWRVRSVTGCGSAAWSTTWSFTTSSCSTLASTDVGQSTDVASFNSIINVTATGNVSDINIASLDISHPWIGDLRAELMSPAGTVVELFNQPGVPASNWGCNGDDLDVSFDDAAAQTSTDFENACGGTAPAISGAYQSMDPLSNFNGESVTGNWTLIVYDEYVTGDVGTLNGWSLEFCTTPATPCNDPDQPALGGTTSICEGGTTILSVTSGNLNDASDWYWYEGSCGGTALGTGTTMAVSPTTTTSYFVRGEGGCVSPGTCVQIDVTVNPTYSTTENASVCQGQTYTFPDGTTSTTATTHTSNLTSVAGCDSVIVTTLTVTPPTPYNETVDICQGQTHTFPDGTTSTVATVHTSNLTTPGGCDSVVVTTLNVVTSFNTTENVSMCAGDTYTFPDGTTSTVATVHTSTLQSSGGCDSIIVSTLTINTVDVSTTSNGPSITAGATGATFQWIDCDNNDAPIAGATGATFTPTALVGNYAVVVTQNGCSDTSACTLIDQTGIDEFNIQSILIYPNPADAYVKVSWEGEVNAIELTDAVGKRLVRIETNQLTEEQIDLTPYADGLYFINVIWDEGRSVHEVVKQ